MRNSLIVKIEKIHDETADVKTLFFKRPFEFKAGQCISVYFDDLKIPEGRAYSLSSLPDEDLASITVKNIGGRFSLRLCSLKVGDNLEISPAYGFLDPETKNPVVAIVAGVGLSPVWTILARRGDARDELHYVNKTEADILFAEKLGNLSAKVNYYITRQPDTEFVSKRPDVAGIVKNADENIHFLLCGGVDFVKDIFKKLTEEGVDSAKISSEIFFESIS